MCRKILKMPPIGPYTSSRSGELPGVIKFWGPQVPDFPGKIGTLMFSLLHVHVLCLDQESHSHIPIRNITCLPVYKSVKWNKQVTVTVVSHHHWRVTPQNKDDLCHSSIPSQLCHSLMPSQLCHSLMLSQLCHSLIPSR